MLPMKQYVPIHRGWFYKRYIPSIVGSAFVAFIYETSEWWSRERNNHYYLVAGVTKRK